MNKDNNTACLQIDFRNYWHAGSGRGSGAHLDAVCERDESALPVLPGRQLKGLLRNAISRGEQWGWLNEFAVPEGPLDSHEELLFGSRSQSERSHETQPGMLQIGSAHLPEAERRWLAQPSQAHMRGELFGELFSTAINEQGTAQRYSLRGLEVCIPVTLQARVALGLTAQHPQWRVQQEAYLADGTGWAALRAVLPLLDALGAHRSRGLGEATTSLVLSDKGAE